MHHQLCLQPCPTIRYGVVKWAYCTGQGTCIWVHCSNNCFDLYTYLHSGHIVNMEWHELCGQGVSQSQDYCAARSTYVVKCGWVSAINGFQEDHSYRCRQWGGSVRGHIPHKVLCVQWPYCKYFTDETLTDGCWSAKNTCYGIDTAWSHQFRVVTKAIPCKSWQRTMLCILRQKL